MGRIFRIDSPVMQWLQRMGTVILCGLFWLLCCIPVITAGASTTAMYRMMFNLRQDKSARVKDFFHTFAAEFKKATLLWLIATGSFLLLVGLFLLIIWSTSIPNALVFVLGIVLLVLFFIWLFVFSYAYAYTAFFTDSIGKTLKNCLLIAAGNLRYTIPVLAIAIAPVSYVLILIRLGNWPLIYYTVLYLVPIWVLVIFPFIRYWQSYFFEDLFDLYAKGDQNAE